jgi:hypothetical protein
MSVAPYKTAAFFGGATLVPTVAAIQLSIERAWNDGFDSIGAAQVFVGVKYL